MDDIPVRTLDEVFAVAELDPRLAGWPTPSLATVKGTWLGALDPRLLFDYTVLINPDGTPVENPYEGQTVADLFDAYLYLGRRDALSKS
ncbi:MAG: hypothetical protein M3380_18240, partial [Chloroflexota bacterium]|nr:hypothetical protein [Chloroflexota bacterium]